MVSKFLFVCSGNTDRSPTAEELVNKEKGVEAKSAGTSLSAKTNSKELTDWADYILVMEEHHKKNIVKQWPESEHKIKILNIEDK